MKKGLALLLCFALCLGLSACGGSNPSTSGKYGHLISMLEDGNYTGAVNYINQLAYEAAQQNKGENQDSASKHMPYLLNTWEEYNPPEGEQASVSVTLKEDGTCTIGEKNYLWSIDNESDTGAYIQILDGATQAYRMSVSMNDKGQYSANVYDYTADADNGKHIGTYINYGHYEAIVLTKDNWQDYFELVEVPQYTTNSFGETIGLSLYQCHRLKEEYFVRSTSSSISKIAVEYSYQAGKQMLNYDLSTKTYTLKEFIPNTAFGSDQPKRESNTTSLYLNTALKDQEFFGFYSSCSAYTSSSSGEQYFSSFRKDFRIERIQGTLYLMKDLTSA